MHEGDSICCFGGRKKKLNIKRFVCYSDLPEGKCSRNVIITVDLAWRVRIYLVNE